MEEFIANIFESFGPYAVFLLLLLSGFGIPLGEDFIVIPAGMLIAAGRLDMKLTIVLAYAGVVLADFIWFGIISRYGTLLLHKKGFRRMIHPRRLLQAKHQMDRRGAWMIVFARFIPGSRSSAITVSAMLHLPFWKFALATTTCVLITVPIQVGLGYLIARGIGTEQTARLMFQIVGFIMLMIVGFLVMGKIRQHRTTKTGTPRAKAKWLRKFRVPNRPRLMRPKSSPPAAPTRTDRAQ